PGGIPDLPHSRQHADPAAGVAAAIRRAGQDAGDHRPLQEWYAQLEGNAVPAAAGVRKGEEPQGRYPGVGGQGGPDRPQILTKGIVMANTIDWMYHRKG